MLCLALELAEDGVRVLVTTTTHIAATAIHGVDVLLTGNLPESLSAALSDYSVVSAASPLPEGKLSAPSGALLYATAQQARWIIIRANG